MNKNPKFNRIFTKLSPSNTTKSSKSSSILISFLLPKTEACFMFLSVLFILTCLSTSSSSQQQLNIVKSLAEHLQNMSKSELEYLVKSVNNSTSSNDKLDIIVDRVIEKILPEEQQEGSESTTSTLRSYSFDSPFLSLLDEDDYISSASAPEGQTHRSIDSVGYPSLNINMYVKPTDGIDLNLNTNNKKREIEIMSQQRSQQQLESHDHQQQQLHQRQRLPLEKLFPEIQTSPSSPMIQTPLQSPSPSSKEKQELNEDSTEAERLKAKADKQGVTAATPDNENKQNRLTSALLNHSMHSNYESDEELDRLVFSQLPQGSKLVLKTVQIIKTDEDGNEEPMGDSAISWDVIPVKNGTDEQGGEEEDENGDHDFNDDGTRVVKFIRKGGMKIPVYGVRRIFNGEGEGNVEDAEDDEEEGSDSEAAAAVAAGNEQELQVSSSAIAKPSEKELSLADQESAGSRHTTARHQAYKHGANEKEKENKDKYYHGKEHSQEHIKTKTDKDGKKVTDYEGTEKDLTDYINAHGKKVLDEHERYKNSKKKNKGRKVTGFKRVYHKEEFQRTEHFYDDEEAKKIAESYGLTDQKEKSNHGTKQDKRKYHGTKIEHTDVDKLKNEHITKDGHHKGADHVNEHTEKHKHGKKYKQHVETHTPAKVYHNQQHQQQQHNNNNKYYHPNHNYQGQYSQHQPTAAEVPRAESGQQELGTFVQYAPAPLIAGFMASNGPPTLPPNGQKQVKSYLTNPNHYNQYHRAVAGSQIETSILPTPEPTSLLGLFAKPTEMKVFFAERERQVPEDTLIDKYYAPNFGPEHSSTEFYNKMGNASPDSVEESMVSASTTLRTSELSAASSSSREEASASNESNGENSNAMDSPPEYYSTIIKMTPRKPWPKKSRKKKQKMQMSSSDSDKGNPIGVQKAQSVQVSAETIYPSYVSTFAKTGSYIYGRGNRYAAWSPIGSESKTNETIVNKNNDTFIDSTEDQSIRNNITNNNPGQSLKEAPLPPVLIAKPRPYRIRRPPLNRQLAFRPKNAVAPLRGQTHYYGTAIINHPPPSSSLVLPTATTILQRIPHYPQLMVNGFVNSMTGVFGRVG